MAAKENAAASPAMGPGSSFRQERQPAVLRLQGARGRRCRANTAVNVHEGSMAADLLQVTAKEVYVDSEIHCGIHLRLIPTMAEYVFCVLKRFLFRKKQNRTNTAAVLIRCIAIRLDGFFCVDAICTRTSSDSVRSRAGHEPPVLHLCLPNPKGMDFPTCFPCRKSIPILPYFSGDYNPPSRSKPASSSRRAS